MYFFLFHCFGFAGAEEEFVLRFTFSLLARVLFRYLFLVFQISTEVPPYISIILLYISMDSASSVNVQSI